MAAPDFSWNTITAAQTDADSVIDEILMEALRQNQIHLEQWLGDGYTAAKDHDHDDVNSKAVVLLPAGTVDQAALKTTTGEASTAIAFSVITLVGGEWAFFPQVKNVGGAPSEAVRFFVQGDFTQSSYATRWGIGAPNGGTSYAKTRYVQASGKDDWLFLLYDGSIDKIISGWYAPDHPCYGQGGNEIEIPHPFVGPIDPGLSILLIDNSIINELKSKRRRNRGILEIINDEYTIDFSPVKPIYKEREIIEIDHFGDMSGEIISKLNAGYIKKRRIVTDLPAIVEYRNLKLK